MLKGDLGLGVKSKGCLSWSASELLLLFGWTASMLSAGTLFFLRVLMLLGTDFLVEIRSPSRFG